MFPASFTEILSCPDCRGDIAQSRDASFVCHGCSRKFPVEAGIVRMLPLNGKQLPPIYDDPEYQKMSEHFDDSSPYFTDGNGIFKAIHESAHLTALAWEQRWPVGGWAVDIGCGQGYHWRYLEDFSRVIGFDIRMESLVKLKERFPEAILVQGNILNIPFKTASIDRATSIYALEHIYFLEDALAETARILASGAKFIVGLPCEGGLGWTLGRKLTSERTMSKRYNVDYRRYIALEHCNTAARVEKALGFHFRQLERKLFPFAPLPLIDFNLTLSIAAEKL